MPIHHVAASAYSPEALNGLKIPLMLAKRRSSNHPGVSIVLSEKGSIQIDMRNSHQSSICKVLAIFFFSSFNVLMKSKVDRALVAEAPRIMRGQMWFWTRATRFA